MSHSWDKSTSHVCMIYLSRKCASTRTLCTHMRNNISQKVCLLEIYTYLYILSLLLACTVYPQPSTSTEYGEHSSVMLHCFLFFSFFFAFGNLSSFHWISLYSFTYLIPLERAGERYHLILTPQLSPGWAGSDVRLGSKSRHWPSAVSSNGLQQQQQVQRTLAESVAWVCLWEEFVPSWSAECPCGVGENDTEVRSCVLVCDALCVPTS